MTPVEELVATARAFHALHAWLIGWWCPGCRILARIDRETAR